MILISIPVALSLLLAQSEFSSRAAQETDRVLTPLIAQQLTDNFESRRKSGFDAYLSHLESTLHWHAYLFKTDGTQLFGDSPSPEVRQLARAGAQSGLTEGSSSAGRRLVSQKTIGANGE